MIETPLQIATRFRGPPESGNGGYTCGLLAERLGGPACVTLKKPPPLERTLVIRGGQLLDGEELVAEAELAELELHIPNAPSFDEAAQSSTHYAGHAQHIYPECFVCGPARAPGDGLRIFAGRSRPDQPVIAPW